MTSGSSKIAGEQRDAAIACLRDLFAESGDYGRIVMLYEELASRAGVEIDNLHETVNTAADALESKARAAVQSAARRARSADPMA